jgi:hypothetical protein
MTFDKAAEIQYLRKTLYTVEILCPDGRVEKIGATSRKSVSGLIALLRNNKATQKRFLEICGDGEWKRTKGEIKMASGHTIRFGATIRQAATEGK